MRIFYITLLVALFCTCVYAVDHPVYNHTGYIRLCDASGWTTSVSTIQSKVSSYLTMSDTQLEALLSTSGRNSSGSYTYCGTDLGNNITMVDKTYALALLYHLTGNDDRAHRAEVLLKRYAAVFPSWPKYLGHDQGAGTWTTWYHWDLGIAMNLALAYDMIYDTLDAAAITTIEGLLEDIIQNDLNNFRLYIFNQALLRPAGLVVFGRVLDDPQLVHLGYWYLKRLLHEGFGSDGFWYEGNYTYHRQLSQRYSTPGSNSWRWLQAFLLDGYSDPTPFSYTPLDSIDPSRWDNFSYENEFGDQLDRMYYYTESSSLPNDHYPILNETSYYGRAWGSKLTESKLFGGIGHAAFVYGSGSTATHVRFDYTPAISHTHYDALHLIYYDKSEEVLGGTGYRENNRSWNASTKNQNLVVIDGAEQTGAYYTDFNYAPAPYVPNSADGTVDRKVLGSTVNKHNNLKFYAPGYKTFDKVNVVEADALDAYKLTNATQYKRCLALVNISGSDMYLIDLFRVKGGTQYDYCLHGGHNEYTTAVTPTMGSDSGTFGSISFSNSVTTASNWTSTFTYSSTKLKTTMLGVTGTKVWLGTGPESTTSGGYQDYIVARRTAAAGTEVNYMGTHEAYTSSARIASLAKLEFDGDDGTAIGMKITLDNGMIDYVVHTFDDGPTYVTHTVTGETNFVVEGRFAHVRTTNGDVTWMFLVQGEKLTFDDQSLESANGDYSHRGTISSVERKNDGGSKNAFVTDQTLPAGEELDDTYMIVEWDNEWTWGYQISDLFTDDTIVTDDEPGFTISGSNITHYHFPVAAQTGASYFTGPADFIVPGLAVYDGTNTFTTDSVGGPPPPGGGAAAGFYSQGSGSVTVDASGTGSITINTE